MAEIVNELWHNGNMVRTGKDITTIWAGKEGKNRFRENWHKEFQSNYQKSEDV